MDDNYSSSAKRVDTVKHVLQVETSAPKREQSFYDDEGGLTVTV